MTPNDDADACLWCGQAPTAVFGFCKDCMAAAFTISERTTDT